MVADSQQPRQLRRRRGARVLIVVMALCLMGALYTALAPVSASQADGSNAELVATGKNLFAVNCASCHGMNGEGLASEGAPSLTEAGAAAVEFQVSTGRMPAASTNSQAVAKQNTFTSDEIAAMAAYVASLGNGPAIPASDQYSPSGLSDAEIATGGELFRTNCSACHNFKGAGGALPNGVTAPSLENTAAQHVWEAMRTGPGQMPVFGSSAIPDSDVKKMIAYLEQVNAQPSAGLSLGGLGPVSEGFWGWVIGIGVLALFAVWITTRGARS